MFMLKDMGTNLLGLSLFLLLLEMIKIKILSAIANDNIVEVNGVDITCSTYKRMSSVMQ